MLTISFMVFMKICESCKSQLFYIEELSFKNSVMKDEKLLLVITFVNIDNQLFMIEFDEVDYSLFMPIEATLEEEQELERLAQLFLVEISETKYH